MDCVVELGAVAGLLVGTEDEELGDAEACGEIGEGDFLSVWEGNVGDFMVVGVAGFVEVEVPSISCCVSYERV